MNVTIIHGSPRKGNTYNATQIFKAEMQKHGDIEFTEFFLPKDLPEFCFGCMNCFTLGKDKCPHAKYTLPILDSMLKADALIFTTPVFCMQVSGAVKNFLDHFGHIYTLHKAEESMFKKKAFILSTAANGGAEAAINTIRINLEYWGVGKTYSKGLVLHEVSWQSIEPKYREKLEVELKKAAIDFYKQTSNLNQ